MKSSSILFSQLPRVIRKFIIYFLGMKLLIALTTFMLLALTISAGNVYFSLNGLVTLEFRLCFKYGSSIIFFR